MYNVRTENFEGPFDLLVYLIEKSRMNIYDINVSEITEQYIDYMKQMKKLDVGLSSDFLVLAATLILLKSKMLLPSAVSEDDDEAEAADPRIPLVERLIEYKKFKYAAELLSALEDRGNRVFTKPQEDFSLFVKGNREVVADLNPDEFISAFTAFLLRKKRIEDIKKRYSQIERDRVTLEDKMSFVMNMLSKSQEMLFAELIDSKDDLFDIVLTFLSMLELLKSHELTADQDEVFGEIRIAAITENRSDD